MLKPAHVLIVFLFAASAAGQDPQKSKPTEDERAKMSREAQALLEKIDKRIYYPKREGMKDVQFRYHVKTEGPASSPEARADFWVYFAWKQPHNYRMELQDRAGKGLVETPALYRNQPDQLEMLRRSVQALAATWLIGLPLGEVYEDYYKELSSREVNNKREWKIIMVPKRQKIWNRIVLVVRDGLVRQVTKSRPTGESATLFYRYKPLGKKFVCTGFRQEVANRVMHEEEFYHVVKKDITVLSHLKRFSNSGPLKKQTVKLEELRVNEGLADDYFKAPGKTDK